MGTDTADPRPWLSVRVPPGSEVGFVVVRNRDDGQAYQDWLSPFEVWVGGSEGAASAPATRCAEVSIAPPVPAGPFVVRCPAGTAGAYVTLRLSGPNLASRYLTVGELEAFGPAAQGRISSALP